MMLRLWAIVFASAALLQSSTTNRPVKPKEVADEIVIVKSAHEMTLLNQGKSLHTYQVAFSTVPVGAKERNRDHKVPEGEYRIDYKNPVSQFHLALHVSYPNEMDRARARKLGVEPGGEIEIHGLEKQYAWMESLHRKYDWMNDCIAVTNAEIEEIYPLVPVGTKVENQALKANDTR
jgi:murein L,D-transpeptidase YafK